MLSSNMKNVSCYLLFFDWSINFRLWCKVASTLLEKPNFKHTTTCCWDLIMFLIKFSVICQKKSRKIILKAFIFQGQMFPKSFNRYNKYTLSISLSCFPWHPKLLLNTFIWPEPNGSTILSCESEPECLLHREHTSSVMISKGSIAMINKGVTPTPGKHAHLVLSPDRISCFLWVPLWSSAFLKLYSFRA